MKTTTFISFLFFFIAGVFFSVTSFSQTPHIDSLLAKLETMPDDTNKAILISEITKSYMVELNNPEKIAEYAEKGYKLSKKINFKRGIGIGIFYKGFAYWSKGNYLPAIYHYKQALRIMKEVGNRRAISYCYLNIGQTYCDMGNYPEALKYMFAGLKIKEELNDKIGLEVGYNNIGNIFQIQGNYTKALTYFLKTLQIAESLNDKLVASYAYTNIGSIFLAQNKQGEALVYFKKALAIQEVLGDKSGAGSSYTSIGNIYFSRNQFNDALLYHLKDFKAKESLEDKQGMAIAANNIGLDYFALKKFSQSMTYQLKSYDLCNQISYKRGLVSAAGGLGKLFEEQKKYQLALKYYDQMMTEAKALDFKEGIRDAYSYHASVYTKMKQFEKALHYTELFHISKDTLLNKENFKQVAELNTRYETDKKEKEILLLTKDQQLNTKTIKQQQFVRWGLIGGMGLLFISAASIYRRYRFKQKANVLLESQKKEIEEKNVLITDSIDYAKTIQEAVLPKTDEVKQIFNESFILYQPKDIVSGDFYWTHKLHNRLICAVADCTGHGVPGAFMSLLGYNMIENAVKEQFILTPSLILNTLSKEIHSRLSSNDAPGASRHGMDISLIAIDPVSHHLEYAGAHNPIYIVRNSELIELKANKWGIGDLKKAETGFHNHIFELQPNDMIYLFTDGFPDQLGGPNRKKFFYPPFKELLLAVSALDMETQKARLMEAHLNWRHDTHQQTDDILIMGIRYC